MKKQANGTYRSIFMAVGMLIVGVASIINPPMNEVTKLCLMIGGILFFLTAVVPSKWLDTQILWGKPYFIKGDLELIAKLQLIVFGIIALLGYWAAPNINEGWGFFKTLATPSLAAYAAILFVSPIFGERVLG